MKETTLAERMMSKGRIGMHFTSATDVCLGRARLTRAVARA